MNAYDYSQNTNIYPEIDTLPKMPDTISCDVAVVGGGPNGLITAAYLAKAGLNVTLLERRYECGGGLATEEILFPGFYANTHATYHMMVDYMPVLTDFDLSVHSLKFLKPTLQTGMIFKDGSSLIMANQIQETANQILTRSREDAASFETIIRKYQKIIDEIVGPATYYKPMPLIEMAVNTERTKIGKELAKFAEDTPVEIISKVFKDDQVRALFLYVTCMFGLLPNEGGLGFLVPLMISRLGMNKCTCIGGSHRFASSLAKEVIINKGLILENAEVTRIITENGNAVGVELAEGLTINAKTVVSSLDPQSTFLNLVGKDNLPGNLAGYPEKWKWEKSSLFTTHVALDDPVTYKVRDKRINNTFMNIMGIESMEDVVKLAEGTHNDTIDVVAGHSTLESLHDSTLTPPGKHTAFFQMLVPSTITGGWEAQKAEVEAKVMDVWRQYAENLTEENIKITTSESPLDIETRNPCMKYGSIKHGEYNSLQMGYYRPNDLCSETKTPIDGLYVCGASTYPGGFILGGPGYIAANRIADDMGVQKWWTMPDKIKKYVEVYVE